MRYNIALLAARHDIHTVRWANGFTERGFDVHLLSMHDYGDPLHPDVSFHHLPIPTNAGYFLNTPIARSIVGKIQPDLLHAHYASGYGTLGRLCNFHPYVLSVWGRDVYEVPYKSMLHRRLVRGNLQAADYVCSTSKVMADQACRVGDLLSSPTVTPFGVDLTLFQPSANRDGRDNAIVIGTVKRLRRKYGVDLLIDAFHHLRDRLRSHDNEPAGRLQLRIVGDGREGERLRQQVQDLGLGEQTTFTGWVPHNEVPDELNKLDIYVATSRSDSESFGVAVLEASACGIPVVVSDVGGLPEVVKDGVTGFVVDREDSVAAGEVLYRLVRDSRLRKKLGAAGRAHVQSQYAWDECVSRMESVYDRVVESC